MPIQLLPERILKSNFSKTKMSNTYCQNEISDPIFQKQKCQTPIARMNSQIQYYKNENAHATVARKNSQIQFFKNENVKYLLPERILTESNTTKMPDRKSSTNHMIKKNAKRPLQNESQIQF
jgi:hypothetical protein